MNEDIEYLDFLLNLLHSECKYELKRLNDMRVYIINNNQWSVVEDIERELEEKLPTKITDINKKAYQQLRFSN
jgi:hypothetical protein